MRNLGARAVSSEKLVVLFGLAVTAALAIDSRADHAVAVASVRLITPWHAGLYEGALVGALVLFIAYAPLGTASGTHAVGAATVVLGALGDAMSHLFSGIGDRDAVVNWFHLAVAIGALPLVSGPLRAAWTRPATQRRQQLGPALLSAALVLALFWFLTEHLNAFATPRAVTNRAGVPPRVTSAAFDVLAVALVQSALTMAVLLPLIRRFRLPPGALTFVLTTAAFVSAVGHDNYRFIPVALLSGVLADSALDQFTITPERRFAWLAFAMGVPATFFALYFIAVTVTDTLSASTPLVASVGAAAAGGLAVGSLLGASPGGRFSSRRGAVRLPGDRP